MTKLIPDDEAKVIQNHYDIEDYPPVVKLFLRNATWPLSEIEPFREDIALGLHNLGMGEPKINI